jgi:hypothetical protein
MTAKQWMGSEPRCDFCPKDAGAPTPYFVDGKTRIGPWAIMCPTHHKSMGLGLGTGRGQKYDSATLKKLEG